MNEPGPTLPYYDRSTGLIVFGVLTIGLGCLAALLCLVIILGAFIQTKAAHVPVSSTIPGLVMYSGLSVVLVWLGIGSILAKRWARNLMLIFSWSWLVTGVFAMILLAVIMPMVMTQLPRPEGQPAPPPAALWIGMGVVFVFYGFFLIVLPAIWTFFYNSRHVKGTCEWRDPNPGWTDACPLPVLGFCLWTVFSAVVVAAMALSPHGVAPFFGVFLTGLAGRTLYAGIAAIWFIAAGMLYRLDARGWWILFAAFLLFSVSAVVTYATNDMLTLYRLMGYPQEQIDMLGKMTFFKSHAFAWITGLCVLPFLGYLVFIKRYLR